MSIFSEAVLELDPLFVDALAGRFTPEIDDGDAGQNLYRLLMSVFQEGIEVDPVNLVRRPGQQLVTVEYCPTWRKDVLAQAVGKVGTNGSGHQTVAPFAITLSSDAGHELSIRQSGLIDDIAVGRLLVTADMDNTIDTPLSLETGDTTQVLVARAAQVFFDNSIVP